MREISIDVNAVQGPLDRFFSHCVGAGRAGEIMRYVPAKQLLQIQKDCSFRYIRFHGLFHEEMHVVFRREDGSLGFNFQYVDLLIDQLLEAGLRPVLELGLMPQVLAEKDSTVFWWKMHQSLPEKIEEWHLLIQKLVEHLTRRYGRDELKEWYFEVWNEPNHPAFFSESSDINAYFKLYDAAADAVKSVDACYRIGGPATAGLGWIPEMIAHCKENDVPLDFISSHHYGVRGDFDEDGKRRLWLCPSNCISDALRRSSRYCKEAGIPFFVTEWSSSYSPRDAIHDSYINAPYLLHEIKRCEGYVQSMSYWAYTDIFEEINPPEKPFHGGFGLVTVQSVPKPSYHVYRMLNRLGDTKLVCEDEDSYVCKSDDEIQVLFWNVKLPKQDVGNTPFFHRRLESAKLPDTGITLHGLKENSAYSVRIETVGYGAGDAYDAYLDEEFTDLPTPRQTEVLIEKSAPRIKEMTLKADGNGVLSFSVEQTENQVDLILLKQLD